ncbi:hypothetical protein OQA88_8012 [Cercophora sp. LCS_1]
MREIKSVWALISTAWLLIRSKDENDSAVGSDISTVIQLQPHTDSGYGSAVGFTSKPAPAAKSPQPSDHGGTSYTEGSVSYGSSRDRYVNQLAEDIYEKLNLGEHMAEWRAIAEQAPKILKAFAIKLGASSQVPKPLRAMIFVHRHSDVIVKSLNQRTSADDPDMKARSDSSLDKMTLEDKMAFWAGKTNRTAPAPAPNELFEGVPEDDDDLETRDMDGYKDVIIKDGSYLWLIATLRTEMALCARASGGPFPRIRDVVLDQTPSGVISSLVMPSLQDITVRFDWEPKSLLTGTTSAQRLTMVSKAIAILQTSTSFFACTVKDYMARVWPSHGRQLVELLDHLVGRHRIGTKLAGKLSYQALFLHI